MEACELGTALESRVIDGFEDADVYAPGAIGVERKFQHGEDIRETLYADAEGAMVADGVLGGLAGVIGCIDELLKIAHYDLDHRVQERVVKPGKICQYKFRESHGSESARRYSVLRGNLDDFRAKVGCSYDTEMRMIVTNCTAQEIAQRNTRRTSGTG